MAAFSMYLCVVIIVLAVMLISKIDWHKAWKNKEQKIYLSKNEIITSILWPICLLAVAIIIIVMLSVDIISFIKRISNKI